MRKFVLIILAAIVGIDVFAQSSISGKIVNANAPDTLTINLPFIFGYSPEDDIQVPVNENGDFKINLPLDEQKFVTLTYHQKKHVLLLNPLKELSLILNAADSSIQSFSGSAAPENRLLDSLNMLKLPFFRQKKEYEAYGTLSPETLQEQLIKPWLAARDQQLERIRLTQGITESDKLLIAQEVKANAILQLSYFARLDARMTRPALISFLLSVYKDISPKPDILPAGPLFYEFADSYVSYMEAAAFNDYQKKGENDQLELLYYGISLDSANRLVHEKGKFFMNWLSMKNNFHPQVAESMLAQRIEEMLRERQLTDVRPLLEEFQSLYTDSRYISDLTKKKEELEASLIANESKEDIQIVDGYQDLSSIIPVVNRYKGKVVYLDVWGTWCPPCRQEMNFVPSLKQHFKNRDVVFIYLDMDDDSKDASWREFIKVNDLAGLHLRKNSENMQQIWDELQPKKEKQGIYPSYFIFDRDGNLVPEEARRPSEGAKLYEQIERYLL